MKSACLVLGLCLAATPLPAFATGSLECVVTDDNLDLSIHGLFAYSGPGTLFQVGGEFKTKNASTAPGLRAFAIEGTHLKQQWFEGQDLRLQLYAETTGDKVPFGSVEVTILARQDPEDETSYAGDYRLDIEPEVKPDGAAQDKIQLTGKVACTAG